MLPDIFINITRNKSRVKVSHAFTFGKSVPRKNKTFRRIYYHNIWRKYVLKFIVFFLLLFPCFFSFHFYFLKNVKRKKMLHIRFVCLKYKHLSGYMRTEPMDVRCKEDWYDWIKSVKKNLNCEGFVIYLMLFLLFFCYYLFTSIYLT